ncbi:hypothetical protein OYC64_001163 [Pagothenia borchgrevinki]|uniref:LTD domain-containing protein n=1 Tax=Pagothenia borchgrevinki TaxID=8213 RepID=A0ABD2GAT2_PAGBO
MKKREEEMKEEMKRREEEMKEELKKEMTERKEFQAGHFEVSDHSQSVEPPRPPPNTQTSDSGFHIQVDQHGKCIRLMNSSTEDKHLGEWHLDLQVNNKTFMHRFDRSFYLRAGAFVNMWVKGYGPKRSNTDLVWKDLKPWCSGDRLKFSLYSHTGEMQYERSV